MSGSVLSNLYISRATMARHLATVMDEEGDVRLEGTIPREGNQWTLPLTLEFYSTQATEEQARTSAANVQNRLRGDRNFSLTQQYRPTTAARGKAKTATPKVVTKKLDWASQQKALDNMFDNTLKEQYKNLPNVEMSSCLTNITLLDYQIQGIKWLLKKETEATAAPFYKKVKENKQNMYLCEITQSSQVEPPKPIRGSVSSCLFDCAQDMHSIFITYIFYIPSY